MFYQRTEVNTGKKYKIIKKEKVINIVLSVFMSLGMNRFHI